MADTIRVTIVETGPPGPAGPQGPIGPTAGGGGAIVSPIEPATATVGDMWFKDDTDQLYVFSGTTGMWEEIPFVADFADPEGTLVIEGGAF